jgi:hypothetical protein
MNAIGNLVKQQGNIMFDRLFTIGCSFTQYWRWPTWADALGRQANFYENWGLCGAGNSYILYSLMECHQQHQLTSNDTVMIMWTNTSREDRYLQGRWQEGGNVYWSAGSTLPQDYVKNFTCERGYLIRDMANIAATKHFLESVGCQWKFMSMVPLDNTNEISGLGSNPNDVTTDDQDVRKLYQNVLDTIHPSVYSTLFNNDWRSRPGIPDNFDSRQRDFHPTPMEHVEYITQIFPGIITEHSTIKWMADCEQQARENTLNWPQPNRPKRL